MAFGEGNPIRKLVQLIFDKSSGKQVEDEAKKSLGAVDKTIEGLRKQALKLAASIAAAFSVAAIVKFGRAAVAEFNNAEVAANRMFAVWQRNAGAVNRTFEEMQAFAREVEQTTLFGQDEIQSAISQLLTYKSITEDIFERTIRIGTDISAVFETSVASSVQAVAKALDDPINGLGLLRKQNFTFSEEVERQLTLLMEQNRLLEAQDLILTALEDELGGVAMSMRTGFVGAQKSLNEAQQDFREIVGKILVEGGGLTGVYDTLAASTRAFTEWVKENEDVLTTWINVGILAVVDNIRLMTRVLTGLTQFLAGTFGFVLTQFVVAPVLKIAEAFSIGQEWAAKFWGFLGGGQVAAASEASARRLREQIGLMQQFNQSMIDASETWVKSGAQRAFTLQGFQFSQLRPGASPRTGGPMAGLLGDDEGSSEDAAAKKLTDTWGNYYKQLRVIWEMKGLLGDEYNELAAVSSLLQSTIEQLIANGLDPEDAALKQLVEDYKFVVAAMEEADDKTQEILDRHESRERSISILAQIFGDEEDFNELQQRIDNLRSTIESLADAGVAADDPVMLGLIEQLQDAQKEAELLEKEMKQAAVAGELAGELLGAAMGAGIGPFAASKAKQNAIEAAELGVRALVSALNPLTATQAPVLAAAAGKHLAIAAAWGTLAGATGGFSPPGGGATSDVGGRASEGASAPANQVHVYLDPLDPRNLRVQQFHAETSRQVRELWGDDANVLWHPASSGAVPSTGSA